MIPTFKTYCLAILIRTDGTGNRIVWESMDEYIHTHVHGQWLFSKNAVAVKLACQLDWLGNGPGD